jgi:anaerobic ribonucleoside-triphosphate reductase activating protein
MSVFKIAGVIRESIVDGPGIRYVVFTQGCPHRCEGCQNPQTWSFEDGKVTTTDKIISDIGSNPLLSGVTLSGGEPFCQPVAMAELAKRCHERGLNVIVYTGYLFEELIEQSKTQPEIRELLNETDVLVDGPFITALKSYELKFMGSSNQRALDVKKSLEQGKPVIAWI